jgi:hypothetical protein
MTQSGVTLPPLSRGSGEGGEGGEGRKKTAPSPKTADFIYIFLFSEGGEGKRWLKVHRE